MNGRWIKIAALIGLTCVSTGVYSADWKCGEFKRRGDFNGFNGSAAVNLSGGVGSHGYLPVVASNEKTEDFLKNFSGKRLCIKGYQSSGTFFEYVAYDAAAGG